MEPQMEDAPMDDMERWMSRLMAMRSWRAAAVLQLLRIEEEGAFSGLVSGAPIVSVPGRGRRGSSGSGKASKEDWDVEDVVAGGGRAADVAAVAKLDARDQRIVTEVVNGTTRWRRRLDFTLGALSRAPLATMDAPLAAMLRLGCYELVELKAPPHIINEYVELAKKVMHQGAGSVANGMLRNVARGLEAGTLAQPPAPDKSMSAEQAAEALAIAASHPTWMVQGWLQQYGPAATMALLRHNNTRPRYAMRLAPGLRADETSRSLVERGAKARPSRYLPREFVVVEEGMQAALMAGLVQRGDASVQDEAAGLVVAMLDPQPGEHILDACAAPGGKTLFAAARMGGRGEVVAMDVGRSRLAALRDMARRQGLGRCITTVHADLRAYAQQAQQAQRGEGAAHDAAAVAEAEAADSTPAEAAEEGGDAGAAQAQQGQREGWAGSAFDRVLVDAPCSGTGVLIKRADLRWKRTEDQVAELVELQAQLLDAAASLVAPGGLLVYSTCSIERRENEDQVAAFLARHPGQFAVEPPPPSTGVPAGCLTQQGCLAMLPHVHGTDGAFAARLRRVGGGQE